MHEVVRRYVQQVGVPLMLDSTDPAVLEAGLKLAGGRCALNSTNLEDGEEKFGHFCGLAKKYGAAVVMGCIDEDPENAMARTEERKIGIAKRIRDLGREQVRAARLRPDVRPARAADQHGVAGGPPQRPRNHRRHAADQRGTAGAATRSSA